MTSRCLVRLAIAFSLLHGPVVQALSGAVDALTLIEMHCVECHGAEKIKGGLDLMTRDGLIRGGESGVVVIPGKPDQSLLVQVLRHEEDPHMPRKADKLPDAAITLIADWVKAGVPYERPLKKTAVGANRAEPNEFTVTDVDRNHWAFQPVKPVEPPPIRSGADEINHPIDRFILAKLQEAGLQLSPPAGKETLIRRVTFDLIGLPPTPAEIDTFLNDSSPHAYEALLDRLLDSLHYGERWGRHWLDLARFAESDGFEHDAVRPHSWRYRDYVINSFNEDKPYDRFIREQLAGDELWPDDVDAVIATGFNLLGPDMVDNSDQVRRRHDTLNDMTDTAALTFLGLTMGCARCHDHKFEPISQKDYYSLQAFFTPAKFERERPIPTPEAKAAYEAALSEYNEHPQVKELAALEAPVRTKLFDSKVAKLAAEAQVAHRTPAEERNAEQANLVLETADKVAISEKDIVGAMSGPARDQRKALLEALKKIPKPEPLPRAMALRDGSDGSHKTTVLRRGDYTQPGDEVTAGFPAVLGAEGSASQSAKNDKRVTLSNWIASPENPLTARVMVNRIWQHHFGRGLVPTLSEFGTHGQKPTHPELLDWLAGEFVARGWRIKSMHRLMLTSAAYRQSSATNSKLDPENQLYGRMNRLRLEGEVIRDSLLAISGRLNRQFGGRGVFPPIPRELFAGASGWTPNQREEEYSRRSIYIFARRNLRFPFLEVFDAPDSNLSCPERERSTTALQSLTLLNADEVIAASQGTAARLEREVKTDDGRIALACRLVLGRQPSTKEMSMGREFLAQSPLSEFCRALFNLNDFVYLD